MAGICSFEKLSALSITIRISVPIFAISFAKSITASVKLNSSVRYFSAQGAAAGKILRSPQMK